MSTDSLECSFLHRLWLKIDIWYIIQENEPDVCLDLKQLSNRNIKENEYQKRFNSIHGLHSVKLTC